MRRAYQNRVLTQFRKYYPDADTALDSATWEVMELFWNLDLSPVDQLMQDRYSVFGPQPRLPSDMLRSYLLSMKSKVPSLTSWASSLKQNYLYAILSGFMAGDTPGVGTPVYTGARERKTRTCDCLEKGIRDCKCNRIYHQPDCNIGWDSHRDRYYFGYDLYMLTASDSESDLPVFPLLGPASRHDSHGFLYNYFSMRQFLPQAYVSKLLLDSAHDAMAYYKYCRDHGIQPFIDLNDKCGRPPVYKDDFTIGNDGVPICKEGFRMRRDGTETSKGRTKFKCPKISFAGGSPACTCEHPCSDAAYGRTVHLVGHLRCGTAASSPS